MCILENACWSNKSLYIIEDLPGSLSNGFLRSSILPKCVSNGMVWSGSAWHLQKWQVSFCFHDIAMQVLFIRHCNACSVLLMPHSEPKHVKCRKRYDSGYSNMSPNTAFRITRFIKKTLSILCRSGWRVFVISLKMRSTFLKHVTLHLV